MKTVVLKFGGSSLATRELRELAASRVLEARARGASPVVVCSALGRAPDPYATDSLLALLGPNAAAPNRDLLLGCGEAIACAVFAESLASRGADAQAMTGGQAGIVTDASYGAATIVRVRPTSVIAALERGIIPVITGFQGVTDSGAVTTLGRGGSDLSAIALGDALGSDAVEIYTDVDGVMTGDPRRIAGAHTLDRVNYAEMVELASDGATIMHGRAAEFARASETPYVVKGLRSGFGTTIDEGHDHSAVLKPVTGLTSRCDVAFVHAVAELQGDVASGSLELELFRRLAQRDVSVDMVNINSAGVFFIVDRAALAAARDELDGLTLTNCIRPHCAKLSIVGAGMRGTSGVMYRVMAVLANAGIEIIHSTDSSITISLLVPAADVVRAEQALHDDFGLGQSAATPADLVAGIPR